MIAPVSDPSSVSIASPDLRVTVNCRVGGTITAVEHLGLRLSVLGQVPWDAVDAPIGSFAARDEAHWLSRYGGGWPLLFPNAGDACTVDGVFHGFHGEASVAPWSARVFADRLVLERRFITVPAEMRRELTVERDVLVLRERLTATGPRPIAVMWGHHPTFGSDLLAGPVEITSGACKVSADDVYDPPSNPLRCGATGDWPLLPGKTGAVDLGRPEGPLAALAYLHDFTEPWVAIRRLDGAIAAALSWSGDRFPCAWLWYELGGTPQAPWFGRGRLVGIEPNTTRSAGGLADALSRGGAVQRLSPGEPLDSELRLHVFKPLEAIRTLDADGRGPVGR